MIDQILSHGFNAVGSDQLRGLGLKLRELKDGDFGGIVRQIEVYRNAVYGQPFAKDPSKRCAQVKDGEFGSTEPLK
jgi:hypothetical protein